MSENFLYKFENQNSESKEESVLNTQTPESQPKRERQEVSHNQSRRDFLRRALGLAVASVVSTPEDASAIVETEKSHESLAYKKGILEMHKLALKKKVEVAKMYIKDGDKEIWINASEETGEARMVIGGKRLEQLAQDENFKPERVDIVHTHPKNLVESLLKIREKINARPDEFRSPPSIADLFASYQINTKLKFQDLKTKFNHKAIDHTGVWTFDTPANSPIMELVARENDLVAERDQAAFEYLQESKDPKVKAVLERLQKLKSTDPRLVSIFIDKDTEVYMKNNPEARSNPAFQELQTVREKINQNRDYKWIREFELQNPVAKSSEKREEDVEEYIKRCKNLGITITYEPIEAFE